MNGEQVQISSRTVGGSRQLGYSDLGVHGDGVVAAVPALESESEKAAAEGLLDSATSSKQML